MTPPTSANLRDMATLTIEAFQDHRIVCYDYEPLRQDLLKLRAVEKSYGIRLESPRDNDGHGDTFSAFALALMVAHEESTRKRVVAGAVSNAATPAERAREMFGEDIEPAHPPGFGWGCESGTEDARAKALRDLHQKDPFFRNLKRR